MSNAINIQDLFNKDLPESLRANALEAKSVNATFQINITGPGGGQWNINATSTGPNVTPGESAADTTVTIDIADAKKLFADPKTGMGLFFSGKLKVSGNHMNLMKLEKLFVKK